MFLGFRQYGSLLWVLAASCQGERGILRRLALALLLTLPGSPERSGGLRAGSVATWRPAALFPNSGDSLGEGGFNSKVLAQNFGIILEKRVFARREFV